jgi:polar amino acid transport system substrate-binding protein
VGADRASGEDPSVSEALHAEFAPTGVLRAGINLGNPVIAQRNPDGGDPRGAGPALARELARRIGVAIRFVTFETAGKLRTR